MLSVLYVTKTFSDLQRYNLARYAQPISSFDLTHSISSPPSLTLVSCAACSDYFIGNATAQSSLIPTANLTNGTTYSGQTSYGGYVYQNSVQYVTGYLTNTSSGINHYLSVGANGTNAVDGLVALLTVKILSSPVGATKTSPCVPLRFLVLL